MKIIERYSAAVNSDNLAVDPRSTWGDSDVLGAAGLAARYEPLGVALTRLFADGKPEAVVRVLADMAFKRARTLKARFSDVELTDLAKAVLAWYRHGTCQPCGGTGYQLIPGTPALGDECKHCRGTGRIPFDSQFQGEGRELARWLSGEIDRSQVAAGRAAMAMLAPRLEL
jgi:hypothetical protein